LPINGVKFEAKLLVIALVTVRLSQTKGVNMFIKSFVTIFLALFYYFGVLFTHLTPPEEATKAQRVFLMFFTWFVQAYIGANLVVFLYYIWS